LPPIANLFGVSVDCILGINISEKEEKINAILEKCKQMTERREYCDAVTVLRNALSQYPSEPRLMYQLAWNLTGTIMEHRENLYEAIRIYEKILQITDDPELRSRVLRDLMYRYSTADDLETAKKIANSLVPFEFCREYNLGRSNLLYGRELAEYLLNNIVMYGNAMKECLEYFTDTKMLSEEQMSPLTTESAKTKLKLLERILDLTDKFG
jgi:tetratricopeptide (TPR) repeat protein